MLQPGVPRAPRILQSLRDTLKSPPIRTAGHESILDNDADNIGVLKIVLIIYLFILYPRACTIYDKSRSAVAIYIEGGGE